MSASKHPTIWEALKAEFEPGEVKTRSQAGRQLRYITARAAMDRLDAVLGEENWSDEYTPTEKGLRCRINYRLPGDPEWLFKEDGGAAAGMNEADNDEKSAYSDAFKRAAVKLGVGRYLYKDGAPGVGHQEQERPRTQERRPAEPSRQERRPEPRQESRPARDHQGDDAPRSGRALFAWCKQTEQNVDFKALGWLNDWAKPRGFPGRMVDWDAAQTAEGYEAIKETLDQMFAAVPVGGPGDDDQDADDDDIPF